MNTHEIRQAELDRMNDTQAPRFVVMTAAACMPACCKGRYGKVAVVECSEPGVVPKQIHPNHKTVKRIVAVWDRQNVGHTERCAFQRSLAEAKELCTELNQELTNA